MSNFKNPEMVKLEQYLIEHGYNYEAKVRPWASGDFEADRKNGLTGTHEQITVRTKNGEYLWDVVFGYGTYGFKEGLLELMGEYLLGHDDVDGYLTADDVIEKIKDKEDK